ncbi:GntR family transcriptional regulator [Vallitalea sediminicola]
MRKAEEINYKSPMYLQLKKVIYSKIQSGEYLPGTSIPSENELAKMYGINRLTVRNGIDQLVNKGLLMRVQGKGVYVLGTNKKKDVDIVGGFEEIMKVSSTTRSSKILKQVVRKASDKFSCIFGISCEDEIYYIKRIIYVGGIPSSLEEIYIPKYLITQLDSIDLSVFSIEEIYDFYGIIRTKVNETIDLTILDANEGRMLKINANEEVMVMESTSFDDRDRVIDYRRKYSVGNLCKYGVCMKRD